MSDRPNARRSEFEVPDRAWEVHVVKPLQFEDRDPQAVGMRRLEAISHALGGSESLWAGVMLAEPGTSSPVHHHGSQETVAYVLSGKVLMRWGSRLEHEVELESGDFLLVPPFMPHQEINPSPDKPAMVVVVRNGQEAALIELPKAPSGEYVAEDAMR